MPNEPRSGGVFFMDCAVIPAQAGIHAEQPKLMRLQQRTISDFGASAWIPAYAGSHFEQCSE
jgi:hypothetical protein